MTANAKEVIVRHNFHALRKEIYQIIKDTAKVEKLVISDIKTKFPPILSKATATIYNIKKGEVSRANYKTEGRGTEKLATRSTGTTIETLTFYFRGKRHADWKTTAKPKPKAAKSLKVFSNKRKYTTFQEVFRGKKTPITGKGDNRVFVANIGGKLAPMVIGSKTKNKPLVRAATSVPDAIMNEQVKAIWQPELNTMIRTRLAHHAGRYMSSAIQPPPDSQA